MLILKEISIFISFPILVHEINDYAIKVPPLVEHRVAKIVDVQLKFEY